MTERMFSLRRCIPIAAISLAVFAAPVVFPRRSTVAVQDHPSNVQKFHALLKRGVGTEVSFAVTDASAEDVRRSVNSVASFIRKRSGLELNRRVTERLAKLEASALKGERRRIAIDELAGALTETLLERVATLSNAELEQAANTLCGLNATDPPVEIRRAPCSIRLRANQVIGSTRESFVQQLKALGASDTLAHLATDKARDTVGQEARRRVESLRQALPEQWGDVSQTGLTPLQGLLISYSALSDDYLWYSEIELKGLMRSVEKSMARKYGHYPSSDGRFAYGVNGYIFPTPLDLVLSGRTLDRLLDHVEERSTK